MKKLTENNLTETAIERLGPATSPRMREIISAVIRHSHALVRELGLTPDEWYAGVEFLTAVGQKCDDKRQEFILLSDTLGVSALVDMIANRGRSDRATEASLLGPFYRANAPELPLGADIANGTAGQRIEVRGTVSSIDGTPLAGALLDVWHAAPNGKYDLQDESQPEMNLRGRFRTDTHGRFNFLSIKANSYPVPVDGPVGAMLRATDRHPFRPAHLHFIISAPDHARLVTALYIDGDAYLDSDAVFGSRQSLVTSYKKWEGNIPDVIEHHFVLDRVREFA